MLVGSRAPNPLTTATITANMPAMPKHDPTDHAVLLRNSIGALASRRIDRLTLRAVAIVLLCYEAEPAWTMTRLSAKLDVRRQAVSNACDTLAAEGLIRRAPHPADHRSKLVRLTPSGRALCRSLVRPPKGR
jgi:DNA-binding MarR family transcriptional regulator